jgi:hypothetical protein
MDTSDYSFGYVAGWGGGGPEAIQGIKESAARIQKASTAVLKTFEAEEPTAEVANELSVDVKSPQLVAEVVGDLEHDPTRDYGDPQVDEPTGPVQIEVREVESPDERSQENSVELSFDDEQVNKCRPLSGEELDVLDVGPDVSLEI